MDLRKTRFYHSGELMNFTVFSDRLCRVKYLETLRSSIRQGPIEVYVIEPSSFSQWVIVQEWDWGKSHFHFFVRNGKAFPESHARQLPNRLRKSILQHIPCQSGDRSANSHETTLIRNIVRRTYPHHSHIAGLSV